MPTTTEPFDDVAVALTPSKPTAPVAAVWRGKGYADTAATTLYALPDPFVTEAILTGGIGIDEARKQVDAIAVWLRGLGTLRVEIDEAEKEYKLEVVWESKKD